MTEQEWWWPRSWEALERGLAVGTITRDTLAQLLYSREDWELATFSLAGHPHLQCVRVAAPDLPS